MESHPCEKSRGAGAPSDITSTTEISSAESEATAETALCRHIDGRGHRCRMLVMSIDADLCAYHAQRRMQTQRGSETAATELLACVSDFSDAASVNRFLGNLVKQVTLKRIPRRDAVTLAYICQLLLNSLTAISREEYLRLEEARFQELQAQKRPPQIIWDIPGPPYEPPDPLEAALAKKTGENQINRSQSEDL
jgi:hypothetical protein